MSVATALWDRYCRWLHETLPQAYANLPGPASLDQTTALETHLGIEFPSGVRDVRLLDNGQLRRECQAHRKGVHACLPTLTFFSESPSQRDSNQLLGRLAHFPEMTAKLHRSQSHYPR